MQRFEFTASHGRSEIFVGDVWSQWRRFVGESRCVFVCDRNLEQLYSELISECDTVLWIEAEEQQKTLDTVRSLFSQLLRIGVDRSWCMVGVGGGITCDITGFIAATYMRGLPFGFIPTTLLAQVDAAIGGKNGVNFDGFKNIMGVVRHPCFVFCDPRFLQTLHKAEWQCGFAEVIKAAIIGDPHLFTLLEKETIDTVCSDKLKLEKLIARAIQVKLSIVAKDDFEEGVRRKLNLGHTVGHAIEKVYGIAHGQAVALGMIISVIFSLVNGWLKKDDAQRMEQLIKRFVPPELKPEMSRLIPVMLKDKKKMGERIHFVIIRAIGEVDTHEIDTETLMRELRNIEPMRLSAIFDE